jgi:hypothetical protein
MGASPVHNKQSIMYGPGEGNAWVAVRTDQGPTVIEGEPSLARAVSAADEAVRRMLGKEEDEGIEDVDDILESDEVQDVRNATKEDASTEKLMPEPGYARDTVVETVDDVDLERLAYAASEAGHSTRVIPGEEDLYGGKIDIFPGGEYLYDDRTNTDSWTVGETNLLSLGDAAPSPERSTTFRNARKPSNPDAEVRKMDTENRKEVVESYLQREEETGIPEHEVYIETGIDESELMEAAENAGYRLDASTGLLCDGGRAVGSLETEGSAFTVTGSEEQEVIENYVSLAHTSSAYPVNV